jgi:hypothetical protein
MAGWDQNKMLMIVKVDGYYFFFSVRSCLEELFSKEYYSSKVL